jgi:hypothetical protein
VIQGHVQGLLTTTRLGNDVDIRIAAQRGLEPLANQVLIVHEHHPDTGLAHYSTFLAGNHREKYLAICVIDSRALPRPLVQTATAPSEDNALAFIVGDEPAPFCYSARPNYDLSPVAHPK